jgi:hypothetical protein
MKYIILARMSKMNVNYIKENALEQLKKNINSNLEKYLQDKDWIKDYFASLGLDNWFIQSRINMDNVKLIVEPEERGKNDFENAKRLYSALKDLSLIQASDERLWVYLCHVTFWDYMRARWDVEKRLGKNPSDFITERYFFMSNRHRALVRNGIARLWWFGYVSFDESREDPFELTEFMLSKQDIASSLMERQYSNNRDFIIATLSVLKEFSEEYPKITSKKSIQNLAKHIQQLGGITILDALDREEIKDLVKKWISNNKIEQAEEIEEASLLY